MTDDAPPENHTPPGGDRRLLSAWTPALGVLIGTYITVQTKIDAQDMGTAILDPMALGLVFAIAVVLVSLPIWAVWKFLLNRPRPDGVAQPIAAILVGVGYWDIRVGNGELFALWGPWSQLILTVMGLGIMLVGAGLVVFSFWRRMTGRCGDSSSGDGRCE